MSIADDLAAEIARLTGKYPEDALYFDTRLPLLASLTDDQIHVLVDLVQQEGRVRGFGSYWYE